MVDLTLLTPRRVYQAIHLTSFLLVSLNDHHTLGSSMVEGGNRPVCR